MPLGLAIAVLVLLITGIIYFVFYCRRSNNKKLVAPLIIILGVALLAVIAYIALSFIFVNAAKDQPADASTEPATESAEHATASIEQVMVSTEPGANSGGEEQIDITVSAEINSHPDQTSTKEATSPSSTSPAKTTAATEFMEPTEEELALHPDVLGLRDLKYPAMPIFVNQDDLTKYILHKFLNNCFEFEFYLRKDLAASEGDGYVAVDLACQTAMSYYLFSAYDVIDNYSVDAGEGNKLHSKVKLTYLNPEYDLEARRAAIAYILENPVPKEGFTDYESEKEYARGIHDFIGKRITYAPLGHDLDSLMQMKHYDAYQEAYNALAAPDYTAVCGGYARGFALIAQYAGINAAWVYGNEDDTTSHAWNVIYPCDGSTPVTVDLTWNDTNSDDAPGQVHVSDYYFYLPVSHDYEHVAAPSFGDFLDFINYSQR